MISNYERGLRSPERSSVERIAIAFAGDDTTDSQADSLLTEGYLAAGFLPPGGLSKLQRIPEELEEVVAAYTGIPDAAERAKARKVMETAVRVYGESSPDSEILEPVR